MYSSNSNDSFLGESLKCTDCNCCCCMTTSTTWRMQQSPIRGLQTIIVGVLRRRGTSKLCDGPTGSGEKSAGNEKGWETMTALTIMARDIEDGQDFAGNRGWTRLCRQPRMKTSSTTSTSDGVVGLVFLALVKLNSHYSPNLKLTQCLPTNLSACFIQLYLTRRRDIATRYGE